MAVGPNQLIINVSQDYYRGNAKFTVMVDGVQIGSVYTTTAIRSVWDSQDFVLSGNFAPDVAHKISVNYINDDWDHVASGGDRNLYVNSIILGGHKTVINQGQWGNGVVDYVIPALAVPTSVEITSQVLAHDNGKSASDRITSDGTVSLTGKVSTKAGTVVKIYDGASMLGTATLDGQGGWKFSGTLVNGSHNLKAVVTDATGSATSNIASTVIVDKAAPVLSLASYDAGVIKGAAEAGSTVKIFDGTKLLGTLTAPAAGQWQFATELAAGVHKLSATAEDVAGNTATSPVKNIGVGDQLILNMAEDFFKGDAQFTVKVDGVQIGGTYTTTAIRSEGQSQDFVLYGNFAADAAHKISVNFINDLYKEDVGDRNLYVNTITFNGKKTEFAHGQWSNGSVDYSISPTVLAENADKLVINVSGNAYKGDAQFSVMVDGVKLPGIYTATASHALGQKQDITIFGDFGDGAHKISIKYLNDAYNGNSAEDRNLYINSISLNGNKTVFNAHQYSNGTVDYVLPEKSAPVFSENPFAKLDASETHGNLDPSLGVNLTGVSDYSTEYPFLNILQSSRGWTAHKAGQWGGGDEASLEAGGYLDVNGWITEFPSGYNAANLWLFTDTKEEMTFLNGRYVLQYEGTGTVSLEFGGKIISQEPGKIVFDYQVGQNPAVFIKDIDPQHTGDYIRNVSVVREEYLDLYEAGAIFNPQFIDQVNDFQSFRFMDWMVTNNNTVVTNPGDIKTSDYYTYGGQNGVPLDVMVKLANEAGVDPWFTIPFHATKEYMESFATFLKDNLDPNLKAHIEFSNEVWNFGFQQSGDANTAGHALWGDQYGGGTWQVYYGYKSAEMMDIFTDVFGASAETRLSGELGIQIVWLDLANYALQGAQRYLSDRGSAKTINTLFDALAGNWYLGAGAESDAVIKQWLQQGGEDYAVDMIFNQIYTTTTGVPFNSLASVVKSFQEAGAMAEKYGLELTGYEGGTHFGNTPGSNWDPALANVLHKLNDDPRMLDLYNDLYDAWTAAGGNVMVAFNDIGQSTKYGDFGHSQYLGDTDDIRWQALEELNNRDQPNVDTNNSGAYGNGVTKFGTQGDDTLVGSVQEDYLIGGGGNDLIYGGDGNDGLNGGAGNDILGGGKGNDRLVGGAGNDDLYGHTGADIFVLNATNQGVDTIRDFSLTEGDKLDISSVLDNYDPQTDAIANFIKITAVTGGVAVAVNADGQGTDFTTVANIMTSDPGSLTVANLVQHDSLVF